MNTLLRISLGLLLGSAAASAQSELTPWGNLQGIRVDGQLLACRTSLNLLRPDGSPLASTAHYSVVPNFKRRGGVQIVATSLGNLRFAETVTDSGTGSARIELKWNATGPVPSGEFLLYFDLPADDYPDAAISQGAQPATPPAGAMKGRQGAAGTIHIRSAASGYSVAIRADAPGDFTTLPMTVRGAAVLRVRWLLHRGPLRAGDSGRARLELTLAGPIDHSPVRVAFDPDRPGRPFDGIGGDFRIQFPATDPSVIAYNLSHLRVAWARSCLWWTDWDPRASADPLTLAAKGAVTDRIRRQAELDRDLARRGIPLILTTWDPPPWAILEGPRAPGTYGAPLNPARYDRICNSIAAYLLFLKVHYGVEPRFFSFNEPDIGEKVLETPAQHLELAKRLHAAFARLGLTTQLLLADTSNATPRALAFAEAALSHPEARSCFGALTFHTWGGCEDANLSRWAEAARKLGIPLLVTEAGYDSEAAQNPDLFTTPYYQLHEADLYVRLCRLAQPATIMEWQLTADYSVLDGGGTYGRKGPLAPTMRFWVLDQLGSMPKGVFALPATVSNPATTAAAFGSARDGFYAVHVFNRGAGREATVTGWPLSLQAVDCEVTTPDGHRRALPITVKDGAVTVTLPPDSLVSLSTHR